VLLVLMDGLSDRGQVLVIGATNRPDSIDHALRRPGRFDREVYFSLPSEEERAEILRACTRKWRPVPELGLMQQLAKRADGMAGKRGCMGWKGKGCKEEPCNMNWMAGEAAKQKVVCKRGTEGRRKGLYWDEGA
jgi:hypothetical protein